MCDLLVGKPDLAVGFPRIKNSSSSQRRSSWDNAGRFGSSTEVAKGSAADTTTPPAESNPGYGMCVRSASQDNSEQPAQQPPKSTESPAGNCLPTIMDVAIRCTAPNCTCEGFAPSKPTIRSCDACHHGWVAHALDKLGFRHLFNCHQVELVQPTVAFDVASLMLYGTEAMPIRLKILLDRLFSVLQHEEVVHVLHGFGWTYEDYARGYIIQDTRGQVLDRWIMPTREEEPLILQQFLRFGETKPIAQQLLLQESTERMEQVLLQGAREYSDSDIKRFIQRTGRGLMPLLPPPSVVASSQASSSQPALVSGSSSSAAVSSASAVNMPTLPSRTSKPASSVSSTTSLSPITRSPINSPLSSSPLNKLQNMQPYDYRRDRNNSPDAREVPMLQFPLQHPTPLPSPTPATSGVVSGTTTLTSGFFSHTTTTLSESYATSNNSSLHGGITSDFSATDEGSENDSEAINLSQHASSHHHSSSLSVLGHSHLDSIYAAKKVRHLRKSANPMKRRWNPLMLSGLTTNPATGKKRVQCHVCLKTFCDKGALKIHFSAVHLREMHKCTVDGCNMMFSSRRSRNRHSANPNPKLHTPNLRRKLSHHDGRSSLPFPLIPPSTLMNFNSSNASGNSNLLSVQHHLNSERDREEKKVGSINDSSNKMDNNQPSSTIDDPSPEGVSSGRLPGLIFPQHRKSVLHSPDEALSLTKKPRIELNGDVSNDGDEGIDLSMKEDQNGCSSGNKGVRKRKSFNPTKCAVTSDDDLQYVSTDDSSSDTFVDDNGLLSKSDDFSSDLLEDDSKDEDIGKDSIPHTSSHLPTSLSMQMPLLQPSVPAHMSSKPDEKPDVRSTNITSFASSTPRPDRILSRENEMSSLDLSSKPKDPIIKHSNESEEVLESPLRHLETLSLGAFTGLLNHKTTFSHHIASTTGISYHAPGLGLASTPTSNMHEMSRDRRSHLPPTDTQPIPIPIPSSGVGVSANDSDPDGQLSMLPVYRDASMIGAVDIPVDKENPRRCIACGKIFQNHFGVKTHYQNVHLKLMHKCTVEGCNAAFPSKRSRDRHSANLNLHRKLLSTSADKGHFFDKSSLFPYPHHGLRDDYFSRLYDPQNLPLNFATDIYHGRFPESFLPPSAFGGGLLPTGSLGVMPPFHPAFMLPPTSASSSLHEGTSRISDGREDTPISSISSTPSPRPKSSSPSSISPDKDETSRASRRPLTLDSVLEPNTDGRYSCKFCQRLFVDSAHLRDHYEGTHLPSLLPCPTDDCPKVFLSASDRDSHCEAEDHHHHRIKREKTPPTS
ncbi:zinc finger protein basonuclin-1-like [Uloborus diversus]|uniref:zinc finger protein basonuclin-1-like n=1 Tax=Uloborus diversus TaxID=327109 RepID=UPI00240928EC|nr:zinc finger protein basonuclin-1-like [Uloborus diversus]